MPPVLGRARAGAWGRRCAGRGAVRGRRARGRSALRTAGLGLMSYARTFMPMPWEVGWGGVGWGPGWGGVGWQERDARLRHYGQLRRNAAREIELLPLLPQPACAVPLLPPGGVNPAP
jgi:hypothetical protein